MSLFDCADALGIQVPTSCHKQGKCKECLAEVTAGMECLSPRAPEEKHLKENFRLCCRCRVACASGLVRCHTLRRGEMRVERRALELPAARQRLELDPAVRRKGDRILMDGIEVERTGNPVHGLAMDLGTTTVVLRLFDLQTGQIVADAAFENPQRFGGSDVMSRIQFDTQDGTHLLQRTLAGYINHAVEEFPADPRSIYELVVAGNSTMRDLFFGLNVYSIGQSPFRSITELEMESGRRAATSLTQSGKRLGLTLHPKARVYGLPIISGHVGADAAADMLAVDMANEERLVALMDIGTNTELLLGNQHKILAASCPAGPAFEGGRISCGMPALPGAIERIELDGNGAIHAQVIGGGCAQGLCGSGLVDLLQELLRQGRMNSLGRFKQKGGRIELNAPGQEPIHFIESDVNELAQAKSANAAGLRVIFHQYGVGFQDVDVFYIAGGFGRHLSIESARRIGLIPDIDSKKIVQIGNASIEGASMALLSRRKREELERLVGRVQHCRLEAHPEFFNYFVEGCRFEPLAFTS
jgi:uncharacterized 2Fe-2S/4Fe-4S cluster protein (DUF4445 family)